jgi:hypothetical protein
MLPALAQPCRSFYYKTSTPEYDNQLYTSRVAPPPPPPAPSLRYKKRGSVTARKAQSLQVRAAPPPGFRVGKKLFLGDLIREFPDLQRYVIDFDFLPFFKALFPRHFEAAIDSAFIATVQPYLLRYDHFKEVPKPSSPPKVSRDNFLSLVLSADSLGALRAIF